VKGLKLPDSTLAAGYCQVYVEDVCSNDIIKLIKSTLNMHRCNVI